jgi:hypothetical protein
MEPPGPHAERHEAGSLKMNTALEYSTRLVQEGGRRCKTFNEPANGVERIRGGGREVEDLLLRPEPEFFNFKGAQ